MDTKRKVLLMPTDTDEWVRAPVSQLESAQLASPTSYLQVRDSRAMLSLCTGCNAVLRPPVFCYRITVDATDEIRVYDSNRVNCNQNGLYTVTCNIVYVMKIEPFLLIVKLQCSFLVIFCLSYNELYYYK